MGKVKTTKQDTFIDMTAMSDVTVLLLTFFMLTATFMPKEPVTVVSPASVSETKIPENDVLTILVDKTGKVYVNLDKSKDKRELLKLVGEKYLKKNMTDELYASFDNQTHIGVPMNELVAFLSKPLEDQDEYLKGASIPIDTAAGAINELAIWVKAAKEVNEKLAITIKSDADTPYPEVSKVISTLQSIRENRFSLITSLRGMPEGM